MANEFSNAGIKVLYAVESSSGSRPTSGYTQIPGIKSTPDFNPQPSTLQVTDLSDTEYHRYIPALKDTSGASAFGANFTTEFKTAWDAMCSAYETGLAASKATWIEIKIPNYDSFYFSGAPVKLGLSAQEVGNVFEGNAFFTPNKIEGFATPSTT